VRLRRAEGAGEPRVLVAHEGGVHAVARRGAHGLGDSTGVVALWEVDGGTCVVAIQASAAAVAAHWFRSSLAIATGSRVAVMEVSVTA
jgi:hypothetical protein